MERPLQLSDYRGQRKLKNKLKVHITSAVLRNDRLDHVLLLGPPGCGKTTLANIIAYEMGDPINSFVMPIKYNVLEKQIREGGVLFLDEIHRMKISEQEMLLPLLEDGYLQSPTGRKVESHPLLTIVGATTEPDQIIAPLYDRFPIKPAWVDYTYKQMSQILMDMAQSENVWLTKEAAVALAKATGGTPRIAQQIVYAIRDLCSCVPEEVLSVCGLTIDGLTSNHVTYLQILDKCGGQTGLNVITNHLRLPIATVMDLERLLLKLEYIEYTKQGRTLTSTGYERLKDL